MLSRFRRPEADLRVQTDKTTLHLGDELEARVVLVPKGDFHVRHGKVELTCTESYVQRVSSQYGTSYHRRTETLSRAGETFIDDRPVRRRMPYSTDVRLVVPPDALPTIVGTKVSSVQPGIAWAVTASFDVAAARDIRQSQEVTVVRPPALDDARPRPVVAESSHRQCALTLELSSGDARSGDRIDGRLRAEMLEDVTASEIRVELVRVEKFGNAGGDHTVDSVTLERDVSLQSGRTREWRFRLDVGRVGVPSLKTEKSSVRWLVKGVLSRSLRSDPRVEQDITVDF